MRYIGIDPGKSGGIAVLERDGSVRTATAMPETDRDVLDLLCHYTGSRAVLEHVRASPQMGVVSAFTFGCGYGAVRMALASAGIAFHEVAPVRWQRVIGCLVPGVGRAVQDSPAGKKNAHKALAQQMFPGVKVTHALADALLLAEYCRRLEVRVDGPKVA